MERKLDMSVNRKLRYLIGCMLLLCAAFGASLLPRSGTFTAAAAASSQEAVYSAQAAPDPGNECVSCHLSDDPSLESGLGWRGGISALAANPCPAVAQIEEELFYTERLMQAIERLQVNLPANSETAALGRRYEDAQQSYLRLLDAPVSSLDAFVSEARSLRFRMGKVYAGLNQVVDDRKTSRILALAGLVTLILLASLAWGAWNTRKASAAQSRKFSWTRWLQFGLVVTAIFALLALPLFRDFPAPAAATSSEEQALQATLDTSSRAASSAEQALVRAWMLGRVGAAWQPLDLEEAQAALSAGLSAAEAARYDAAALWGKMQAAQEAAAGSLIRIENAAIIAGSLQSAQYRAWHLRMLAEDWQGIDAQQAAALLTQAEITASGGSGSYRDLDRRAIAAAWSEVDLLRALQVNAMVLDPYVRSWGYREIAERSGEPSAFRLAYSSAREIQDPRQRAYALTKIGAATSDQQIFRAAEDSLQGLEGAAGAYALAFVAGSSKNAGLADKIEAAYPAARALAYLQMGDYEAAWQAAQAVSDGFERGRAQQAIAAAAGKVDYARQVSVPLLRDRALRYVIQTTGTVALAQEIQNSYDQAAALTAVGRYQQALAVVDLREPYPLVALGLALVEDDPRAAYGLLERLDREADKAVLLRALAAASGEREMFERALGFALAARQRGLVRAPVEASLALAGAVENPVWKQEALQQALQAAHRITIK